MTRITIPTALCVSLILTAFPQPSQANDIIDFLRAISGPSVSARRAPINHHDHLYRGVQSHPQSLIQQQRRVHDHRDVFPGDSRRFTPVTSRDLRRSRVIPARSRSGLSFQVSLGANPNLTALPAPPPPAAFGSFDHLSHQYGDVVRCGVPIFQHVHVECLHNVAPNAIPTVVAVRDPSLGRCGRCVEQLVYVQILAPPCPPRRVRVSPCRTRVKLDYGRYDITIESRNGCVTVEYDD